MKWALLGVVLCCTSLDGIAQNVLSFEGKVADKSGKGIAGVVVNDGFNFTQTDGQGRLRLTDRDRLYYDPSLAANFYGGTE